MTDLVSIGHIARTLCVDVSRVEAILNSTTAVLPTHRIDGQPYYPESAIATVRGLL